MADMWWFLGLLAAVYGSMALIVGGPALVAKSLGWFADRSIAAARNAHKVIDRDSSGV